ncbi:MAG TPA: hypothetical protein VI547_11550 [Anaerolineales bacterium]|nr:hypothetical protein [Anaerolineales bacterium]
MSTITKKKIETLRAQIYRRTPGRRVQTIEAAEKFVNDVGFCFFWPIQGVELPNLFHAIAGRVRAVPNEHDDPDISKCWGWKDQSLGQRRWYYAKLLHKKATMVSMQFLPTFYALSPNFGGEEDYLEDYEAGLMSWEAKSIFEVLIKNGPMDTVRLRRESRLSAESAKSTFERALVELQIAMRILPVGIAEAGAWRYSFVYDLVTRHLPDLPAEARQISRRDARTQLVSRLLDNVVAATPTEIQRVFSIFKLTRSEWERTLADLLESGVIVQDKVARSQNQAYLSVKALRAPGRGG